MRRGIQVRLVRSAFRLPDEVRAQDYRAMAEAILSGDGDVAERVARDHVVNAVKRVKEF